MNNQINAALQVLPTSKTKDAYEIVDIAIQTIEKSGLKYRVCPFETVIEGHYDEVMSLIKEVQIKCMEAGAEQVISNIKLQVRKLEDVSIEDKMNKYE